MRRKKRSNFIFQIHFYTGYPQMWGRWGGTEARQRELGAGKTWGLHEKMGAPI